jgi:hypothetical protein
MCVDVYHSLCQFICSLTLIAAISGLINEEFVLYAYAFLATAAHIHYGVGVVRALFLLLGLVCLVFLLLHEDRSVVAFS